MPAESIAELALEYGRAMNEMKSRLRQRIQSRLNEATPTISYELLEVIGLLWRRDGITQQEIADTISKDKSSMTYLIHNLVKRKLVKRVEHESDRRNKRIFLTEKGKQLRKHIFPWALDLYEQAAGEASPAELRRAISLTRKMAENLGK
jgi:DNA-binding MarR family transcriptional regulator